MKKMTAARLTAGLLLVSTLVSPALALTGTVDAGGSTLRVRSEASTSGKVLGKLKDGAQVDVLSVADSGCIRSPTKIQSAIFPTSMWFWRRHWTIPLLRSPPLPPTRRPPPRILSLSRLPRKRPPLNPLPPTSRTPATAG